MATAVPAAPSTGSASLYAPNLTSVTSLRDGYRSWIDAIVDGVWAAANGWDQPWRWDEGANLFPLGSTAPTTFALALSAGAGTALATGTTGFYYLVFAVSSLGKETAPQYTGTAIGVSIANASGVTKDVNITWTDPGGEYDKARIYKRPQGSQILFLVAEVAASAGAYSDTSTDASILTSSAYVTTYRATPPDVMRGLFVHQNMLAGFTGDDPTLRLFQQARADARFVADDQYLDLPIEPNDGFGAIKAGWTHNGIAYVFKERASYQIDGDLNNLPAIDEMYRGRGCLSMRAMIEIDDGKLVILDKLGIYGWIPGGEPVTLGKNAAGISKLAPIWKRMNMGAADSFWVQHIPAENLIVFWVALDYEPIPNYPVVYDYSKDVLVTDPWLWGAAGCLAQDASGAEHVVRLDDVGLLWEDSVPGDSTDGVYAGTTAATLTGVPTTSSWPAAAAAFDTTLANGALGSLVIRMTAAGVVVDMNRVAALSANEIIPLYWPASAPAAAQLLAVGAVPSVAQGGPTEFASDQMKHVTGVVLEHEIGNAGDVLTFRSSMDAAALAPPPNVAEIDLTAYEGRAPVNVSDRGWSWTWELSQLYAGKTFVVTAMTIHLNMLGTPR